MNIIDNISADTFEEGDQIIIDGDAVEIRAIIPTDDIDEVKVLVWSYVTGDLEVYSFYADDYYDVWAV